MYDFGTLVRGHFGAPVPALGPRPFRTLCWQLNPHFLMLLYGKAPACRAESSLAPGAKRSIHFRKFLCPDTEPRYRPFVQGTAKQYKSNQQPNKIFKMDHKIDHKPPLFQ